MHRYHELLKQYIVNSGLSLSEISDQLVARYNLGVDKSYLSRLQNAKTGPGSDSLNRAIAEITGGDPEELLFAAYMEKAPEEVNEKIERLLKLKELQNSYEIAQQEVQNLLVQEQRMNYGPDDELVQIPILGHIAAGQPIFAAEHIEDWQALPRIKNYKDGELFALIVKGDSMIGSRIYEGDKVIVRIQEDVEEGQIAVVNVDGENATLKRVKRINGKVILFADNPKYEPIVIDSDRARICGKVIQVIFDPNKK